MEFNIEASLSFAAPAWLAFAAAAAAWLAFAAPAWLAFAAAAAAWLAFAAPAAAWLA